MQIVTKAKRSAVRNSQVVIDASASFVVTIAPYRESFSYRRYDTMIRRAASARRATWVAGRAAQHSSHKDRLILFGTYF